MRMNYLAVSSIVLVLILLVLIVPAVSYVNIPVSGEIYIDDPRYSAPAVGVPGSKVNITVYTVGKNFTVDEVVLIAPNLSYSSSGGSVEILEVGYLNKDYIYITIRLSDEIKPELYDIIIKGHIDGELIKLLSPRSLWVLSKWPSVLRIFHVTDVHIGLYLDGMTSSERYEVYTILANAIPEADVIFCTGDCVDVGSDISSLKDFYLITNQLRKPCFIVPGNHDHAQVHTLSEFLRTYYGRYIGKPYWVRTLGNFTIIGLDTGSEGYLDVAQLNWLGEVLDKYTNKTTIILFHHPIFNYPGEYVGTHENLNPLMSKFYSSWRDNFNSLKQLMELIDKHPGIVAVFSGHIHRDAVAVYNGRVWFITTTTACGGRPYYRGFRLVYIYANGTVKIKVPEGSELFSDTSAFNAETVEETRVYYNDNMSVYMYNIHVDEDFRLELKDVPLYFYVNASLPATAYRFYGDVDHIKSCSVMHYGSYLIYKVITDILPGSNFKLILASFNDTVPPEVSIGLISPSKPIAGRHQVLVMIKASDDGWGLSKVKLLYKVEDGKSWNEVSALRTGPGRYQAIIPPLNISSITIKAVAEDWAGHKSESSERKITYVYPVTTTSPTTTIPTTTSTVSTPVSTTSSPTTTPSSTTTTPSPIATTPPTTTTSSPTPTITSPISTTSVPITSVTTSTSPTTPVQQPSQGPSLGLVAGIAIVILLAVVAVAYFMRRK